MADAPQASEAKAWQHRCAASDLDTVACEYVNASIALGEHDPDSLDFSIAPASVTAAVRQKNVTLEQLVVKVDALRARVERITPVAGAARDRADALKLQLAAIATRINMLRGRMLPFDAEANALFATERLRDRDAEERKGLRAEIGKLLNDQKARGAGSSSRLSLADRYASYNRSFVVPPQRLANVMRAALEACRQRTLRHVTLPEGEGVELAFVRHQPWSAFSRYEGKGHSTISVNLDLPITVDEALELACHEGYPGHHAFNALREQALVSERHLPEAEVQLTFSPQSYVSEAAAAFAPELAFSAKERLRVEREVLFPIAGQQPERAKGYLHISSLARRLASAEPEIAQRYVDGDLEFARAEQSLADTVLLSHGDASLLYLNEYRSYVLAYTDGRRRMGNVMGAGTGRPAEESWKAFLELTREYRTSLP